MNKVIITELNNIRFLLIYEEDKLSECHPIIEENSLRIGNIYLGRVQKKLKNIDSAFVSLDGENIGYLPLNDKPALVLNRKLPNGLATIAENDIVLVQVEQEPQKMKQARVTGNVSISGQYVALDINEGSIGVSRRIKDEEIIKHLRGLIKTDERFGLIYRTACENAEDNEIINEYEKLSKTLKDIIDNATYERKTGLIYSQKPEYISILEDYGLDRISCIKTDISDIYDEMLTYFDSIDFEYKIDKANSFVKKNDDFDNPEMLNISMYDNNDYPYYKLLGLEADLHNLLNRKVWLKSGGFLIIEPTEAMVVIDVNTGKAINKKDRDKHVLKINLEAACEIARQLRLRNLSGIIMVDFINMSLDDDKAQVVAALRKEFAKDKVTTTFIDITKLDVYEITRKKQRRPLYEVIRLNNDKIILRDNSN